MRYALCGKKKHDADVRWQNGHGWSSALVGIEGVVVECDTKRNAFKMAISRFFSITIRISVAITLKAATKMKQRVFHN